MLATEILNREVRLIEFRAVLGRGNRSFLRLSTGHEIAPDGSMLSRERQELSKPLQSYFGFRIPRHSLGYLRRQAEAAVEIATIFRHYSVVVGMPLLSLLGA